ncbi:MAG: hypothetical protein ACI85N_001155 [Gammaproteobacteria bacterium]|jgi:hypothetical protein
MNNLNLNIPLSIISVGVMLFLLAPVVLTSQFTIQEISMTGLMIELLGIIVGSIMFYRYKVTAMSLEEI